VFKIHPLAIEDAQEFNQRPKIEDYDDFVSLVAYGARELNQPLVEVHAFYAEHFLVTVHRDSVSAIQHACTALTRVPTTRRLIALYRLLDALVDSMFPFLASLDDRIDDLQDEIFVNPRREQLSGLFALKRQLVDMRKLVTPQRDMVSTMLTGLVPIPGMTSETERYVRDLYDHLIRISEFGGQLPRPARRVARGVHVHGVQPAQRPDEAADDHRDRVPAAVVPDRVLRPEPRLAGEPHRVPDRFPHLRRRHRGRGRHRAARPVQETRLDVRPGTGPSGSYR
jgi:CorA-like Mg2+ transporter protein